MASSAPHLLALPRELRDNIYRYLSQEKSFRWLVEAGDWWCPLGGTEFCHSKKYEAVGVHLHNYPITNVLLTNTRIHDEYKAAKCFENLSISVDIKINDENVENEKLLLDPQSMEQRWKIFTRVRHVTIFVELPPEADFYYEYDWSTMEDMLISIRHAMPQLATFRIALQQQCDPVANSGIASHFVRAVESLFGSPDWTMLDDLPLVQRGKGFRLGYNSLAQAYWADRSFLQPSLQNSSSTIDDIGDATVIVHAVHRLNIYTYSKEKEKSTKYAWDTDEVIGHWPLQEYPREVLNKLSEDRAMVVARYPFELMDWVEKRGVEEVKTWT